MTDDRRVDFRTALIERFAIFATDDFGECIAFFSEQLQKAFDDGLAFMQWGLRPRREGALGGADGTVGVLAGAGSKISEMLMVGRIVVGKGDAVAGVHPGSIDEELEAVGHRILMYTSGGGVGDLA